jgi:hypothetical protein
LGEKLPRFNSQIKKRDDRERGIQARKESKTEKKRHTREKKKERLISRNEVVFLYTTYNLLKKL